MENYKDPLQGSVEMNDSLPNGLDQEEYLKKDKEWRGLDGRLGIPRILKNIHTKEIVEWAKDKYKDNPNDFSYFEAGVGHGNDFRAFRNELGGKGQFLGVDMSTAEIKRGLDFYHKKDGEDTEETKKLFAQGDLRDLKHINTWNEKENNFSKNVEIEDEKFDVVYMEAVLHGLGYGEDTYEKKEESGQKMLNELHRICKTGGKFFGRATAFDKNITKEEQFVRMRENNDWRLIPGVEEFENMLKKAGFSKITIAPMPHERLKTDPKKKNKLRVSFLAEK